MKNTNIKQLLAVLTIITALFVSTTARADEYQMMNQDYYQTSYNAPTKEVSYMITLEDNSIYFEEEVTNNLQYMITTPENTIITWVEVINTNDFVCTYGLNQATCLLNEGEEFTSGKMLVKYMVSDEEYTDQYSLLCTYTDYYYLGDECMYLSPEMQEAQDSNLFLDFTEPEMIELDAENYFDLVVTNDSKTNYKGDFEVNTNLADNYDITYVDADTRLNCTWANNIAKCKTKTPQDAGKDTTYKIRVKFWANSLNENPLTLKSGLIPSSVTQPNIPQYIYYPML